MHATGVRHMRLHAAASRLGLLDPLKLVLKLESSVSYIHRAGLSVAVLSCMHCCVYGLSVGYFEIARGALSNRMTSFVGINNPRQKKKEGIFPLSIPVRLRGAARVVFY